MELLEKHLKFSGIYRGKVVDNNDPSKYGRVQVQVYPMFGDIEEDDKEYLPWAKPAFALSSGAGLYKPDPNDSSTWVSYGSFNPPDIGTFVFVFFEMGDIYQPVYFAEAPTASYGLPDFRTTDYPYTRGFKTKSGNQLYIDDSTSLWRLYQSTGTYLELQPGGNVYTQPIATKQDIHRAFSHTVKSMSSGTLTGEHGGLIMLSGSGTINCPNASDYQGLIYLFKRLDNGKTIINCPPNIQDDTYFFLKGKWAGAAIISDGSQWVFRP